MVTLNPWENPARAGLARAARHRWWLSREPAPAGYVHTGENPRWSRAFAAEGFAWNGRYGKYADFRDVR